jgi:site-specific DNA recombinase
MSHKTVKVVPAKTVRCAIYTRKSTEDGLEQEFNSLDAQRESAEALIASQRHEGWTALPQTYDDGGFSGGSMERPALAQLMADIEAGKVDCVVVYKVDRLSRSLLDFARIMQVFESKNVSFVSVTQQFNTTHSMGRLTLNILLSFAQFEREIIGERIRDKIAAQRRKGKWTGGAPVLGYDVDRSGPSPRLVVNAGEAARVREIFSIYMDKGSLLQVVLELERRGWRTKARISGAGRTLGGRPFDKCNLYGLLTNPLYAGRIRHKDEVFPGEQPALVDAAVFERVQAMLQHNGRSGGVEVRNRHGALLKRLLRCKACGTAMAHTFTTKRNRQYRYYTCVDAIKRGRASCPAGSLPAAEVERVVVDQIRCIGRDRALLADVVAEARAGLDREMTAFRVERDDLMRELGRHHAEIRRCVAGSASPAATARLADLNDRVANAQRRLAEVAERTAGLERERIEEGDVAAALADFDNVWGGLSPREQGRLLSLLVAKVDYDAGAGTIAVSFHASGIKALSQRELEKAA